MVTNNESDATTPVEAMGGPKLTSNIKRSSLVDGLPVELL